jgi:simple sugar transport system ATP-binding protein
VKQSGVVLKYIAAAREAGLSVIFISHNPHHAYLVGDHFAVLNLGRIEVDAYRSQLTLQDLMQQMAGGSELQALEHELRGV